MAMMPLAIILLVLALGLVSASFWLGMRRRGAVRGRFAEALGEGVGGPGYDETQQSGLLARLNMRRRLGGEDSVSGEFRQLLHRAGWPGRGARSVFYLVVIASPIVGTALAAMAVSARGQFDARGFALVFAGFVLGFLAPRYGLRYLASARQARLAAEAPLMCRLLAMLLESGLNTEQALRNLRNDGPQVLTEISLELTWLLRRLDAGASLPDAMEDWRVLLDVPELGDLGGLLQQVSRFGGNARQPLLELGRVIEERQLATIRERISKLAVKMTVVMMAFMFPALLILLAGPGFLALSRSFTNVLR